MKTKNVKEKSEFVGLVMFFIISVVIGVAIVIFSNIYFKDFINDHITSNNIFVEMLNVTGLLLIFIVGGLIHIVIHEAGLFKHEINCERMFLELVGNCDRVFIDDLYDKNLKKYINTAKFMISKKRLLMAYEGFYNKDKSKALECYKDTKQLAENYSVKGEADMELMIIERIKENLDIS